MVPRRSAPHFVSQYLESGARAEKLKSWKGMATRIRICPRGLKGLQRAQVGAQVKLSWRDIATCRILFFPARRRKRCCRLGDVPARAGVGTSREKCNQNPKD